MTAWLRDKFRHIDWLVVVAAALITFFGIVTMYGFSANDAYGERQTIWFGISFAVFLIASQFEYRVLRRTGVVVGIFSATLFLLILVTILGSAVKGAQSWFSLGFASFQPTDLAKLALIFLLAKYLAKRHVEIAHIRHIIVSGIYALIPTVLVLMQPDLGSALVLSGIWFCLVLVSGISKKHLALVLGGAFAVFILAWMFVLAPYQKDRIKTFIDPLSDIRGSGYNVYQSQIAIGSGGVLGKGVGFGTQSRLEFLPEHQTDFIFAAFSEEWGFVGVLVLLSLFLVLIWRLLAIALTSATNFELFCVLGILFFFLIHIVVNVGMNLGIMPVTGIPLPFMSYGGSHLLTEWLALGIIMGMRKYERSAHRDKLNYEFLGVE
ncbi:MAG: rod shape-determining protein RodA [Minisyncoccia bacterium]